VQTSATRQQVRRVLLVTLGLNLTVAIGKIVVGLISGALAITADGFHSLIDGTANVVALIANAIAGQPPDDEHPYGHRRFETLAALMIGAFLILVAWEITTGAIDRLQGGDEINLTPATFAVLLGTLVVNIGVSTYQIREGKRLKSELLLADAENTRADVFITLSVIISMAIVEGLGWAWIDIVAAMVVVVLIGHAAWRILQQTGSVLVDTAPYPPQQLTALVQSVPSVQRVIRARSRGPVDAAQIDIDIQVAPEMTAEQTAAIASAIRERLTAELVGLIEIDVHFLPDDSGEKDVTLIARAAADALGLYTHEVSLIGTLNENILELHVEVPSGQTLQQAHKLVSQLEADIQHRLPEIDDIVTHIEPVQTTTVQDEEECGQECDQVRQQILDLVQADYPDIDWHQVRLYKRETGLTLTMHAAFTEDVPIETAHCIVDQAETMLRTRLPQLTRITIHAEPHHSE
jgi:cation diffusion facilitator family transporter